MIDYTETIALIIEKRSSDLLTALSEIEYEHLITSIYGTLLAILCINTALIKNMKEQERFSPIVEAGSEYAHDLGGYTDTLDILTNPDELELLKKSESELKK